MNNFWTNILRYPRFFITSLLGLILVILMPLKNLFKAKKLQLPLIFFAISSVLLIVTILRFMAGL